jgi:CO/xanthine dehydrogenase FAD-binding subunit
MLTDVHLPRTAEAAVGLLQDGRMLLGGGTSLMARLNDYASPPTELVSLRHAGLAGIEVAGSSVTLGAATTLSALQRDDRVSYLADVVRTIASPPVRSLATVGGNLFVPQPHGDLAVALLALDAELDLLHPGGASTQSLEQFLTEPVRGDRLVVRVRFAEPAPAAFRFLKAARRRLNSAAIATIAARIQLEGHRVVAIRVALGGLAPSVVRAHHVEAALIGSLLDDAGLARAGQEGLADISPSDDAYASAWYRTRVFPVHLRRALLGR